jgi:poly-gamma-glutamate synthesis protein (capsule biosynthesis protein)
MTHTIAVSGDTIITERVSDRVESGFQRLHDFLTSVDVTHTHMEALPRGRDQESYPARRTIGQWLTAPDDVGQELANLGFDVVTLPGNHTLDHSYAGLFAAWQTLDSAGVEHAGTGWDLDDARAPAYVESGELTVAFVSATSSFHDSAIAGQSAQGDRRPGVSPLRYRHVVGQTEWDAVVETAHRAGRSALKRNDDELLVRPVGKHYPLDHLLLDDGLAPGESYTDVLPRDLRGLTDQIEMATRQADVVIAHVHAHEYAGGGTMEDPPEFVEQFAHAAVDAGADAVVSQGTHTLRGMEQYDGAPIFYDLGGLFRMQTHGPHPQPRSLRITPEDDYEPLLLEDDEYLAGAGIVPVLSVEDGTVTDVEIHAVRREDGVPVLLDGPDARDVIEELQQLSERFGTELSATEDTGLLQLQ